MIKEKYLVFGGQELGVIISILGIIISFMMKFGVYEVKTIATIILIVIVLLAVFVYCNFMLFIILSLSIISYSNIILSVSFSNFFVKILYFA